MRKASVLLAVLLGLVLGAGVSPADEHLDREAASRALAVARDHEEAWRWDPCADASWEAVEADWTHFDAHVRYQAAALRAGDPRSDLVADYDSFLEEFPEELAFRLHRLRLERAVERLAALEQHRRQHSSDPDVMLEIGRAHLETGETRDALVALGKARSLAPPERLDVLLLLCRTWIRDGKASRAREALEGALEHDDAAGTVRLALGRLELADGDPEAALPHAEAVAALRPGSTAAVLLRAECLERLVRRSEALAVLREGRRSTAEAHPVLLALADLGSRAEGGEFSAEALAEAAGLYETVLAERPEEFRALYGLAWVREREEKFTEAETLYRRAAALRPTTPEPVESVGYALFMQGRISDAQVQFRRAIDLDPEYVSAYANLGATYDARAEYSEAIEWYEKLLKVRGHEDNLRAILNCAFDYEQLGVFQKAEEYLRRACKLSPEDDDLVVWLADNLYFQEEWRQAEKTYHEALEMNERNFYAWRGLGLTLGQQGNWPDAAAALEKAKELKPRDLDILITLGGIYMEELEDPEKALENFQRYVQAGGDDPAVREAITELMKLLEERRR